MGDPVGSDVTPTDAEAPAGADAPTEPAGLVAVAGGPGAVGVLATLAQPAMTNTRAASHAT